MSDRPWALLIDPQRIFADPESDWGSPMFADALPAMQELAHQAGPERTLITRWVPGMQRPGSWGAYFEAWPFADRPADDPIFDLVDDVVGLSAHPSIDLPTFGKWSAALRAITGPTPQLRLGGVSTDCCVISTVLPAADAGAHIEVIAAACAGSTPENHSAALSVMGLYPPQVTVTG
ncbi:cysteine hydrolase family protein [Dermacoccaceae bacterium W4C1]